MTSEDPGAQFRDHDHRVEALLDDLIEDPTPENAHAAMVAVAKLQRSYDHVLRRLHGDGELPEFPVHRHNPADSPEDCANAVLDELAGAKLADRAETLAHGLEAVNSLARDLDSARHAAAEAHHWQSQFHALNLRYTEEVAHLRRELSDARSWAWSEAHRMWHYRWFPPSWAPRTPQDEWHLPDWLTTSRQPHQQDWWTPPGALIHIDLSDFTGVDAGAVRMPAEPAIETGDTVYLTDGATYLAAIVTGIEEGWALVEVRWRGDRE